MVAIPVAHPFPNAGVGARAGLRAIASLGVGMLLLLLLLLVLQTGVTTSGGDSGRTRILLVDDQATMYQSALDARAPDLGWFFAYATSCDAALARADLATFRVFLMDWQLSRPRSIGDPVKTGVECIPQLRVRAAPDAIFLGFSADRSFFVREAFEQVGAKGFIPKGMGISETLQAIAALIPK